MFIPLTQDFSYWDKDKKNLIIEDFVWMNKNIEVLKQYDYEIFDMDFGELGIEENEIWTFSLRLVDVAGEILNQYHETTFSQKYWRRVFSSWIQVFMSAVCLRFLRLEALRKRYPQEEFETIILDEAQGEYILLNPEELAQMEEEAADYYGWHLYSLALKYGELNIRQRVVSVEEKRMNRQKKIAGETGSCAGKDSWFWRILYKLKEPYKLFERCFFYALDQWISQDDFDRVEIVLSTFGSAFLAKKLHVKSMGKVVCFGEEQPPWIQRIAVEPKILLEFRERASAMMQSRIGVGSNWQKLLSKIFFKEMPCCFLENFEACRAVYRWKYEKFPNLKYIVSSPGALFTETKMAMAEQGERGVKFSFMAHGGTRPSKFIKYSFGQALADVFYGWGNWGERTDRHIMNYREAPAEKLYMYESLRPEQSPDILYVGDCASPFLHGLGYHTLNRILQREIRFLTVLEHDIRENIVVRNYPYPWLSRIDRRIKAGFPEIRISREGSDEPFKNSTFAQILLNSRFLIFDHFETPFTEALYANKPLLLYFDKDFSCNYFDPDTEREYVELMEEAGIIQYGTETAARHLNEIYPRIEEWWKEPRRQEIVRILQERYTGRYVDPEKWWEKEILGLLQGEFAW